jgi:hypothetical protein
MWGSLPTPIIVKILSYLKVSTIDKLYYTNRSLQKYGKIELLPRLNEFDRLTVGHAFLRYAYLHHERPIYRFPFTICKNGHTNTTNQLQLNHIGNSMKRIEPHLN